MWSECGPCCVVNPIICSLLPSFPPCDSGVTVIWASPRFGIPIPQTLMIWESPSHITFVRVGLGLQGMNISLGFWEWGCPKRGNAHITMTPAVGLFEETNFDPVSCATSSQPIK